MTLKIISNQLVFLFVVFCLLSIPFAAQANRGLELSVTPTLFEMAAVPSQVWNSGVKVINSNNHDLVVYAEVVNFAPKGESGEGKFLPVFEEFTEGKTLAEWIKISPEAVVIPPESSKTIPFKVEVPNDASPGGHFAAIMVGTRPPKDSPEMKISTSQIVTSLFFVRVAGDVKEDGDIREFTTIQKFVPTPQADFILRFENKGNIHIQPQGQIEITNMWGKERGVIPINHKTHFGNVLPESIRMFEFSWAGEQSLMDIGRYKATVTLGYGLDERQFETAITYFYVVPVKSMIIYLLSLLALIYFITLCIKTYVRRMLSLSGVDLNNVDSRPRAFVREGDVLIEKRKASAKAPIVLGVKDFKTRLKSAGAIKEKVLATGKFVLAYKLFFGGLLVLAVVVYLLVQLWNVLSTPSRNYEVVIDNEGLELELSSEEIIYESNVAEVDKAESSKTIIEDDVTKEQSQLFVLELINAADTPGLAASMKRHLETEGFKVTKIGSDNDVQNRTVVVYAPGYEDAALEISKNLNNALLSAAPTSDDSKPVITVYIGNDYPLSVEE